MNVFKRPVVKPYVWINWRLEALFGLVRAKEGFYEGLGPRYLSLRWLCMWGVLLHSES